MILPLFIALSILGYLFRTSKVLTILIFVFLWVLSWNMDIADYDMYENMYEHGFVENLDMGYAFLSDLSQKVGLDYFQFKLVVMALALSLTLIFILKYAYYPAAISALYLDFMCYFDIAQNRNFIAFSFVLVGLHFFIKYKENLLGKFLYVFFIFLASSIHLSVLFFVLFVVIDRRAFESLQNFMKNFLLPLVIGLVFVVFYSNSIILRVGFYNARVSSFSIVMLVIMYFVSLGYVYYYDRKWKLPYNSNRNAFSFMNGRFIIVANILFFATLPLAIQSLNYLRLFKYMAFVNMIFISNKNAEKEETIDSLFHNIILMIYGVCILLIYYFMHVSFFERVVEPIFMKNIFFGV